MKSLHFMEEQMWKWISANVCMNYVSISDNSKNNFFAFSFPQL